MATAQKSAIYTAQSVILKVAYIANPNLSSKSGTEGLTMAEPKKPFYRDKKWKLGGSFGWWHIPYCPHCKRQLGLMVEEQKAEKCPMCGKPLEWDGAENG